MSYVEVGCRVLLVTVFALALWGKISGREPWARFVRSVGDMTPWRSNAVLVAVAVVVGEGAVIVLVATPLRWAAVLGFALAAALLASFAVATALVVRRGAAVPCRCFGGDSRTPMGWTHVVRDLVLMAPAVLGLAASSSSGVADVGMALIAGVSGAAFGLLITRTDDNLIDAWPRRPGKGTGEVRNV
ncbi:MauE/DoxX family redox-associated membrane protein [Nonomuraea sp. NPDC001023]|uniref:MauE/DoxX family redox-associated membrane protein n=1 Tax=unclassified Nonomuraea TaxID=2593643 RepID=UPI0033346E98